VAKVKTRAKSHAEKKPDARQHANPPKKTNTTKPEHQRDQSGEARENKTGVRVGNAQTTPRKPAKISATEAVKRMDKALKLAKKTPPEPYHPHSQKRGG
jgi:hypothetical protein